MRTATGPWPQRLPFFYGWIIVAAAFVTMAIWIAAPRKVRVVPGRIPTR
jgi:hypothetical protein